MLHKLSVILKWLIIIFPAISFHACFSQQYDAELINQQTTIDVSDGKVTQTHYFEIRINNRKGDKYAEISIPFNKMNKVSNIEASIADRTGKEIKKLKKSNIIEKSESSAISFYEDNYVKEFALRSNIYPYTLKYSYRMQTNEFIFVVHWLPLIDNEIPTLQAILKVTTPAGYLINYKSNLAEKPKVDSIAGKIYYSWQTSFPKPVLAETWSPPLLQFIPYVEIVPDEFYYVLKGSHKSWESYGNWNLGLLNGLDDLPLMEKYKIQAITNNIRDEKEKIRVLFHYLQDATRYINISIKTGGLKPYPASYVAKNKYGDCKALSNYFRSCLSVIDVKAYYTTINAGDVIEAIDPCFPSQQFNHVILFIPLKQDTIWVDCTSDLAFGYLGTFTQNRPAFVLSDNASKLIMTPPLTFSDVLDSRKINARINPDKTMKADFTTILRGDKYELLSYIMTALSESERFQYLGRRIVETGFQMDNYSLTVPDRDTPEICLKYTASSDKMMKAYGNESLVKIIPLYFPFMEEPKKRELPVQIDYPVYNVDSIEYAIPETYTVTDIPKNITITSDYGEYKADFLLSGHSLLAIKQLKLNAGTYPLDEYQKFYNFISHLSEAENSFYLTMTNK
ncbi:MAG: DUF3857 domain-containing protein [Lentimicrobiaceae bacterium]|jgi:hypothetical protein